MSGALVLAPSGSTTPLRPPGRFLRPERHAARTVAITWSKGTVQTVDFTQADDAQGWQFVPRSVHVNNLGANGNVQLHVTANGADWNDWVASGHTRVLYVPPVVPFSMQAVGETIESGTTVLTFFNYVLPPTQDSIIAQAGLFYIQSDANEIEARTPDTFMQASTGSSSTTLFAPAAGAKFRLLKIAFALDADAFQVAAGTWQAILAGASLGPLGIQYSGFVPGAAGTAPSIAPLVLDLGYGGILFGSNETFGVNLSAVLSTGKLRINVMGTNET